MRWLAVLAILLTGCVQGSYNLATHREEYTFTSTEKEVEMGRALAHRHGTSHMVKEQSDPLRHTQGMDHS